MDIKIKRKLKVWGTREGSLNMAYPWSPGLIFELKKYFGRGYTQQFGHFKGEFFHWCEDFEDLRELGDFLLEKFLKDKSYLSKVYSEWRRDADYFLKETKALKDMNLEEKSNQELLEIHNKITEDYNKIIKGYVTDVMQMHLTDVVKERLREYLPEIDPSFNAYYSVLTASLELSIAAKEETELLEMARDKKDSIKQHTEKYFWLGGNYAGRSCFDEKYFRGKLKENLEKTKEEINKEIEKKKSALLKTRQEKERAIKELDLDEEFQQIIKILEKIAIFHDERKESLVAPVYYRIPLKDEIARRLGITRFELNWLIQEEVADALERGKLDEQDREKIKSRSQRCAMYSNEQGTIVADGYEADELFDSLVEKEEVGELKGTVANLGKVRGIVKVLDSPRDIVKMKKGDILVASGTTPDYVPAMKLAGAIVTNEGGITSHAAIVSRELGVPCIIGARNATKVLKDGDMVEVDAEKGVVKVLD